MQSIVLCVNSQQGQQGPQKNVISLRPVTSGPLLLRVFFQHHKGEAFSSGMTRCYKTKNN